MQIFVWLKKAPVQMGIYYLVHPTSSLPRGLMDGWWVSGKQCQHKLLVSNKLIFKLRPPLSFRWFPVNPPSASSGYENDFLLVQAQQIIIIIIPRLS